MAEELTEYENSYLINNIWDEEKIIAKPFTLNPKNNKKDKLIEKYKKCYENFHSIDREISNMLMIRNGTNSLLNEIGDNLLIGSNIQGYANSISVRMLPYIDVLKDHPIRNEYTGGVALNTLERHINSFLYHLNNLCFPYSINIFQLLQPKAICHNSEEGVSIPDSILNKLEKEGFIQKNPLKWNKTLALFAYFVDVANEVYHLKHGEKRQIQPFEEKFGMSGTAGAISEYSNKTGKLPIGHEIIDKIFGYDPLKKRAR